MSNVTGKVVALSISERKGIPKTNQTEVTFVKEHGIEGDAHAGAGHRQVSLLAIESIGKIRAMGVTVDPGAFAENITTESINLTALKIGSLLTVGTAILEITQIGKECHSHCAIFERVGDCVMPREGVFAIVRAGGIVRVGDPLTLPRS